MPPVREASTKPSAATVLPAPVACSNQKRRAARGPRLRVGCGLLLGLLGRIPVERLLVGQLVALELDLARVELLGAGRLAAVARQLDLGRQRDQRARERVDLMRGQLRAVGKMRLLLGQQALEAKDQREVAPPLDRRLVAAALDLLERRVQRERGGRSRGERDLWILPFEHEGFAREFFGALQFVAGNRRGFGHGACFSHGGSGASRKGGTSRAGPSSLSGAARRVVALKTFPRAPTCQVLRGRRHGLLQHTKAEMGSAILRRVRRLAPSVCSSWSAGAAGGLAGARTTSRRLRERAERRARALPRRRPRGLRGADRQGARQAGRGEQVGVLVRALPLRVPLLPEPGAQAEGRGRVPRCQLERQRRRRRGLPGRVPGARSRTSRTRSSRWRPRSTRFRPSRPPPSTTRRASSRSCTRAATQRAEAGRGHRPLRSLTRRVEVREARNDDELAAALDAARAGLLRGAGRLGRGGPRRPRPRGHCTSWRSRTAGDRHLPAAVPRRPGGAARPAGGGARAPRRRRGGRDPRARPTRSPATPEPRRSRCTPRPTPQLYLRDGYAERGATFVEEGIEHVSMEKRLALSCGSTRSRG